MPFYIRKSISAGPFRFNLSKSGLGLSVGVRGLRIGTGPRGHYVHAGRGGPYYRSSIGRAGQRRSPVPQSHLRPELRADDLHHPTVEMVEVESGDVLQMADSRFQTILDDLNGRASQVRLSWIGGGLGGFIWLVSGFNAIALVIALLMLGACLYVDSYRRASVVFYEVEGEAHEAYLKLVGTFETLAACAGKWHVGAGGKVRDLDTWKRNAGAAHLVRKSPTALQFRLPGVLKSNVTPPAMAVGKQWLYLMPDVALFEHSGRFGAIAYDDLSISHQYSRFIEAGSVPKDARVVDYTWRYVNKKGGPDRRFKDNRQLPICLYEAMHMTSPSGLNELLEFSRTDVVPPFAEAVRLLAQALRQKSGSAPLQQLPAREPETGVNEDANANVKPASDGPELWQNVRYGMTLAEVRAAQPAAGPPREESSLGDGTRAELALPGYEAAGERCTVLFYFRAGRLSQVALSFGPSATERTANDLVIALSSRYGSPLSHSTADPEDPIPTIQADWLLPTGVNISLVWMRGIALNANYQFREDAAAGL